MRIFKRLLGTAVLVCLFALTALADGDAHSPSLTQPLDGDAHSPSLVVVVLDSILLLI